MRAWRAAACVVLAAALGGCGAADAPQPSAGALAVPTQTSPTPAAPAGLTRIEAAAETCNLTPGLVEGEGSSIVMKTLSTSGNTVSWDEAQCVMAELEAPSFITDRLMSERTNGETLNDTWDNIEIRWSFVDMKSGNSITLIDRSLT